MQTSSSHIDLTQSSDASDTDTASVMHPVQSISQSFSLPSIHSSDLICSSSSSFSLPSLQSYNDLGTLSQSASLSNVNKVRSRYLPPSTNPHIYHISPATSTESFVEHGSLDSDEPQSTAFSAMTFARPSIVNESQAYHPTYLQHNYLPARNSAGTVLNKRIRKLAKRVSLHVQLDLSPWEQLISLVFFAYLWILFRALAGESHTTILCQLALQPSVDS